MSKEPRFLRDDILEDMVTLCHGFLQEFICEGVTGCGGANGSRNKWTCMTLEEQKDWCDKFALEHAHPIEPSQLSEESVAFLKSWQTVYNRWEQEQIERLAKDRQTVKTLRQDLWDLSKSVGNKPIEECLEQLHLTGREKQTLLGCISIAIEEGLYKDCIDEDSVKHILINLGMNIEDIQKSIRYFSSLDGVI